MQKYFGWSVTLLALAPSLVFAHPGHDEHGGLYQGLMHPIAGVDHLLAMVAVGIWAIVRGGRFRWLAPATFISCMLIGALLGANSVALTYGEFLIALSVVAFGVGIAIAARIPAAVGIAAIGAFALLHGFTHGVEAADGVHADYLAGILLSTVFLHLAGIAAATAAGRLFGRRSVRWSGVPIAAAGFALLLGV